MGKDCHSEKDFKEEGHCISGDVLVAISSNPQNQYMFGELSSAITVGKIFRMLGSKLRLPPVVDRSGFPNGLTVSRILTISCVYAAANLQNVLQKIKRTI